ncbi:hypothetical protein GSI_07754 [Ganoderma sinense ZZ0214-1]|uniref:Uncharacterized protein n=1 Tax=Ganoderma sinense ZZ0214-1 TaxID=1077348 RepID=A0A2G8S8S4_9APHY|nr:hypothetical protein GSI_07681 [Ganoderma sinense ZZ0214-1]PIL30176.1 hypothetical protein GSI_07754 [Ganoderma sinense ZZ0214-1]
MAHQYPAMGQMCPQEQNSVPQTSNIVAQPPWFEALVTAVSIEIKNREKKGVVAGADPQLDSKGAPSSESELGELSPEDEKVLLKALTKREESGLTVQQIFKKLSQKRGHKEIVWKTWFIANFEKLYPKTPAYSLDPTSSVSGEGYGPVCQAGPSTRSMSSSHSSRSSTTAVVNEGTQSSGGESEESESESSDDEDLPLMPLYSRPLSSGETAPTRRISIPVTKSDLRAMAVYIYEKGDPETRRYKRSSWRLAKKSTGL